jgi:hypothetical protein
MTENGKMDYVMAEESKYGPMDQFMRVIGCKINHKARANLFMQMGTSTKETGLKIKRMVEVFMFMLMVPNMKEMYI